MRPIASLGAAEVRALASAELFDKDACRWGSHERWGVRSAPHPVPEEGREGVGGCGRVEVEVDDDLLSVVLVESNAGGRDTTLSPGLAEAVEGCPPRLVVVDLV